MKLRRFGGQLVPGVAQRMAVAALGRIPPAKGLIQQCQADYSGKPSSVL